MASKVAANEGAESLHSQLMREAKEDVFKKYEVLEMLGQGSMGYVCKVRMKSEAIGGSAFQQKVNGPIPYIRGMFRKKENNAAPSKSPEICEDPPVFAMKMIQLDRVSDAFVEELKNEIAILKTVDHPNIVKATEVYVYKKQIYIIMEACLGGDLYSFSPYSERQAASITAQLLSAIKYMHDRNVVHRDLKFENIMFIKDIPESPIKLIDFGLAKKFMNTPGLMTERVGTVYTMAPQVLQGVYSSQADMWSVGVIAYMLLSASKPFFNKRPAKMIDQIMRGYYTFAAPVWQGISEEAKTFVESLLVVDPKIRLTATDALKHDWIVKREKLSNEVPSELILLDMTGSLIRFRKVGNLKKLALNVIAHQSSFDDIVQLRTIFESYDPDHNGVIDYEEFRAALVAAKYTDEDMKEIFDSIDVNKNLHIDYTEFLAATMEAHGIITERRIAEAFDRIDVDHSGYISRQDLKELLGKQNSRVVLDQLITEADTDGDGKISYQEFFALFREHTRELANNVGQVDAEELNEQGNELVGLDAKIPGGRFDVESDSAI